MERNKKKFLGSGMLIFLALLALDQGTKYLAETFLTQQRSFSLIPGVFELYYLQNRGAAFGVLSGRQWFFVIIALVMMAVAIYVYCCIPETPHYHMLRGICLLIAAGALGNMLDRVFRHYVVDFLYFSLIDFPVFNVADCYVCVGAALAVLALFTVYKDDDFGFLNPRG